MVGGSALPRQQPQNALKPVRLPDSARARRRVLALTLAALAVIGLQQA